ncbi:hypothetical protein CDIK_1937 [Cucumispora dikerogammari]|nr:hypothetical protein CDIK_1937 [Cucumispora dikerogammari]
MDDPTTKNIQTIREKLTEKGHSKQEITSAFNEFLSNNDIEKMTYESICEILNSTTKTNSEIINDIKESNESMICQEPDNSDILFDSNENNKIPKNFNDKISEKLTKEELKKKIQNEEMIKSTKAYQDELKKKQLLDRLYLEKIQQTLRSNKQDVDAKNEFQNDVCKADDIAMYKNKDMCTINIKCLSLGVSKKIYKPKDYKLQKLIDELKSDYKIKTILLMKGKVDINKFSVYVKNNDVGLEEAGFYPSGGLVLLE